MNEDNKMITDSDKLATESITYVAKANNQQEFHQIGDA